MDLSYNHQIYAKHSHQNLDLQGHFDSELLEFWLVRAITCNGFQLQSPNLNQMCILSFFQLVWKMGAIDLDLQGHLAISIKNSRIWHLMSLLYTDLGWPRCVTLPNVLVSIPEANFCEQISPLTHSSQVTCQCFDLSHSIKMNNPHPVGHVV